MIGNNYPLELVESQIPDHPPRLALDLYQEDMRGEFTIIVISFLTSLMIALNCPHIRCARDRPSRFAVYTDEQTNLQKLN